MSNIGLMLGWSAASPFAATGYIFKKIYYGIRKAFFKYQLQKEFKKTEPAILAKIFVEFEDQYLEETYINILVPYITPPQMLEGIFLKTDKGSVIGKPNRMHHFFCRKRWEIIKKLVKYLKEGNNL